MYTLSNLVDCVWSVWGEWNTCSVTCGTGMRSHSRSRIEDSDPLCRGADCIGVTQETESCQIVPCAGQ